VKLNVLQFIGSFHQGGSERQAVQLLKLLSEEAAHNNFIAVLNDEGVLRGAVEKIGFTEIPEFPLTSFYDVNFLRQLRRCVVFLKKNKIDIVHTHDFYTNVFGTAAARLAGVRVKIASKRETGAMRSKVQNRIENRVFKTADAITVNAGAVKNYLAASGVAPEKIEVIYNGVDLERLAPRETDRRNICENLGLPTGENVKFITLVANLRHAVKNQQMFLRAARKVAAKCTDAHFVLAGEGDLKKDLETLAKDLRISANTHFVGGAAAIPELLSVSFTGVLTSVAEGFSNSILEYMAAKLPVVATNVGGASEAIVEGETGFLVESNDDEALAEKIVLLLENQAAAKRLGETGAKIVAEKFSLAAQLKNVSALYGREFDGK